MRAMRANARTDRGDTALPASDRTDELPAELRERVHRGLGLAVTHDCATRGAAARRVRPFCAVAVERIDAPDGQVEAGGGELLPDPLHRRVATPVGVMCAARR